MLGFEIAEIVDVSNAVQTAIFSGISKAHVRLIDDGSSAVSRVYIVINCRTLAEATAKLAVAGARMVLVLDEARTIEFDDGDPCTRIDCIADAVESGGNTLYIEGTAV
jgi:hypothetical protein